MRWFCLFSVCLLCSSSFGQKLNCNKAVRSPYLRSKLDSSFCIPLGTHITDIYEVDIDDDGIIDKVVRWQKIKLSDGDTIFYTIYKKEQNGRFMRLLNLGNLRPIYFNRYESKSGNKLYDSIKRAYSYPNLTIITFNRGSIAVELYSEATIVKRLYFTYSAKEKTWILTREMQWFAPTRFEDDRKLEFDRSPEKSLKIENFNMFEYLAR